MRMSGDKEFSFAERPTLSPEEIGQRDQDGRDHRQADLAQSLMNSEDPHVRLIAHMAQRQLDMAEQISQLVKDMQAIKKHLELQ